MDESRSKQKHAEIKRKKRPTNAAHHKGTEAGNGRQ